MEVPVGASWLTTIFGGAAIVGAIAQLIAFTIEEGGMPHDTSTWISFALKIIVGIGLILSKSYNVSNSPTPAAATVVSPADAVKANPAAAPKVP
jgi:hypothetical protein